MKSIFRILFLLSVFVSCSKSQIPVFDENRAYDYLKTQCGFGPRFPGSPGHKACLDYLVQELQKSADNVVRQPFPHRDPKSGQNYQLTNVISSFGSHGKRIMLCAHWDTRPWADYDPDESNHDQPVMGANDGASGVAVLLEIAQVLKQNPPPFGVDIVFFDGEDSGQYGQDGSWCKGSEYFAAQKGFDYNPQFAILLDMVGDKDLRLPIERNSEMYAPDLVDRVWSKAESLGLRAFERTLGAEVVDDHLPLLRAGIPAINIIDFEYPYWHTVEDTEDKCSAESLGVSGNLLLNLIYE